MRLYSVELFLDGVECLADSGTDNEADTCFEECVHACECSAESKNVVSAERLGETADEIGVPEEEDNRTDEKHGVEKCGKK